MQFQVPQFIESETKLVGPFTLKQFLFVAGGVAIIYIESSIFSGMINIIIMLLTAAFFGALAFVKIDGHPFLNYLAYLLSYMLSPKKYLFRNEK